MATELKIDLIEDSLVEMGTINRRVIRKAVVSGIEASNPHSYGLKALYAAGMPQLRDRHPDIPDMFLHWQRVRGRAGETVEVELEYLPNQVTAFNSGALFFRERASLQSEVAESMLVGGKLVPFKVVRPNVSATTPSTWYSTGKMTRLTPIRQLDVDAVLTSRPPAIGFALNRVNHANWFGLPRGYWLCIRLDYAKSTTEPGKFTFGASFLTRQIRNWMEWDFARDTLGRIATTEENLVAAYKNLTTSYTPNIVQHVGVTVAGQYEVADFLIAFGFDRE